MIPATAKIVWIGKRQPDRPWLAQISTDAGKHVETLSGEHETEDLATETARREIRRRQKSAPPK